MAAGEHRDHSCSMTSCWPTMNLPISSAIFRCASSSRLAAALSSRGCAAGADSAEVEVSVVVMNWKVLGVTNRGDAVRQINLRRASLEISAGLPKCAVLYQLRLASAVRLDALSCQSEPRRGFRSELRKSSSDHHITSSINHDPKIQRRRHRIRLGGHRSHRRHQSPPATRRSPPCGLRARWMRRNSRSGTALRSRAYTDLDAMLGGPGHSRGGYHQLSEPARGAVHRGGAQRENTSSSRSRWPSSGLTSSR